MQNHTHNHKLTIIIKPGVQFVFFY